MWPQTPAMPVRNLVAHPLRLEGLLDSEVVQPRPMAVPQPVRCQAWPHSPPRSDRLLPRLLPASGTGNTVGLVPDQRSVQAQQAGPPADRAPAMLAVGGEPPYSPALGRLEIHLGRGRRPR